MGKRERAEHRALLKAAERVRAVQVALIPAVPAGFLVIERVMRSPAYDETTFPTFWVPFLLVVMAASSLGMSWVYHRRIRAAGVEDSRALYAALPSRLGWLCRHSMFVLVGLFGGLWFPASALAPDDWQPDVVDAGTATVSCAVVVALLSMLGRWVIMMKQVGAELADQANPGPKSRRERILALGPAGMVTFAIAMSFSELAGSVVFFFLSLAALLVSLVATFRLGLSAGYRPPGAPRSNDRWLWITACVVGAVGVGFRLYGLWPRG